MQYPPLLRYYIPLSKKYPPQPPVLKHSQHTFLPPCERPSFPPTQTTNKTCPQNTTPAEAPHYISRTNALHAACPYFCSHRHSQCSQFRCIFMKRLVTAVFPQTPSIFLTTCLSDARRNTNCVQHPLSLSVHWLAKLPEKTFSFAV